jgi:hypothetical protein
MGNTVDDRVHTEKAVAESPETLPKLSTVVSEPTAVTITEQKEGNHDHDNTQSDSTEDKSASVDGGLTAWLVVLGAWCASFCSYGWINSKFMLFPVLYRTILGGWKQTNNVPRRCWHLSAIL